MHVFVGPGFVSTSPTFESNSANHPVGVHGWLDQIMSNQACTSGGRGFTGFAALLLEETV